MRTIVLAETIERARTFARELGVNPVLVTSPTGVRGGAGRGLCDIDRIYTDSSVPPDSPAIDELARALGPNGEIFTITGQAHGEGRP